MLCYVMLFVALHVYNRVTSHILVICEIWFVAYLLADCWLWLWRRQHFVLDSAVSHAVTGYDYNFVTVQPAWLYLLCHCVNSIRVVLRLDATNRVKRRVVPKSNMPLVPHKAEALTSCHMERRRILSDFFVPVYIVIWFLIGLMSYMIWTSCFSPCCTTWELSLKVDVHVTVHRDKFLVINQLDALISRIYFRNETLHVSDSSSDHHQEFFTIHTTMVYVI